MTVPIVPGPFSFLESAGQAAGNYGAIREERKRHGEEIAAAGAQSVMAQIMQGYKPASILADPEVQSLFKKAYGVSIPGAILPQPGEIIRNKTATRLSAMTPGGAAEGVVTGVPSEPVAKAGEAPTLLAGRTATAQMDAGLPELQASTAAAVAQAQREGATLNTNIFQGALRTLGSDPKFARLAYEAATGALDARLRMMEYNRYSLSLDRQLEQDRTRIILAQWQEGLKQYDMAKKAWDQQLQGYLLTNGDTPENQQAYTTANPPPDQNQIVDTYFKQTLGYGIEEARKRIDRAQGILNGEGEGTGTPKPVDKPGQAQPAGGQAPPPGQPATTRVQQIMSNMLRMDPDSSADQLAQAVRDEKIAPEEASVIAYQLRSTAPADWYRSFSRTYTANSLRGSAAEPVR